MKYLLLLTGIFSLGLNRIPALGQDVLSFNTSPKKISDLPIKGKVRGSIIDEKKQPLPFVNIMILKSGDSSLVKGVTSDLDGGFSIDDLPLNNYILAASMVGYQKIDMPLRFDEINNELKINTIEMQPETKALKEVVVRSKKPVIEQKADRLIFNVENSIIASGSNALEVLAKAPMIFIDSRTDNIIFKGRAGVQVMIDGKLSTMSATEISTMLKSMPAEEVIKVEIITNPSAKFDAAGTGGLINIRTKKGLSYGTNGSFTVGLGGGTYTRGNSSLNLNHRTEKVNVFGSYSLARRTSFSKNSNTTEYFDTQNLLTNRHDLSDYDKFTALNQTFKVGLDWFPSKKTTIGVLANGFVSARSDNSDGITNIYNGQKTLDAVLINTQTEERNNQRINANINFKHSFNDKGKELSADFDYSTFGSKSVNAINNYFRNNENELTNPYLLRNQLPIAVSISAAKIDYVQPLKEGTQLEFGAKIGKVRTDNDALFEVQKNGNWQNDVGRSNHFKYDEQINAIYTNYSGKLGKNDIQVGLRAEQTISKANSITTNTVINRNYTQLFPSMFISRQINDNNALSLSYSRRINRPSYESLNPFIYIWDLYTYQQGNPFLRPELTGSVQLSYTFKNAIVTNFSYGKSKDVALEVMQREDPLSRVAINRFENLKSAEYVSVDVSFPVNPTKWWSINSNAGLYYGKYNATIQGTEITNSKPFYMANIINSFVLPAKWTAELSGNYMSAVPYGVMIQKPQYQADLGLQKNLWDKKGSLKISFTDIFRTARGYYVTSVKGLNVSGINRWESQLVKATLTYKFGNNKVKAARRRSTATSEEQGRVKIKE
jgi:Outer membrane protein beta-barrel family/CarboxypepD_reg-like domain